MVRIGIEMNEYDLKMQGEKLSAAQAKSSFVQWPI